MCGLVTVIHHSTNRTKYLYRAVDSFGNTLDFMLSALRDAIAAGRFLRKAMNSTHNQKSLALYGCRGAEAIKET